MNNINDINNKVTDVVIAINNTELTTIKYFCDNVENILNIFSTKFSNINTTIDWEDEKSVKSVNNIIKALETLDKKAEAYYLLKKSWDETNIDLKSRLEHIREKLEDWIENFKLALNKHEAV